MGQTPGVTQGLIPAGDRSLALLHRRLAVGMTLAAVVAFGAGVGWTSAPTVVAAVILLVSLFWRLSARASAKIEQLWLPLALLLMLRAGYHMVAIGGDVVLPVVDLLLLLMTAEALRSLDTFNDVRLYGLSFALLLAATAYRPGIAFALAFMVYVVLASPALTLGHLRRKVRQHGLPESSLGRPMLATAGALSGLTLLASIAVFLLFPRASQGFAGRGEVPTTSIAGFASTVSLGEWGSRIQSNPAVVLRVEFPANRPADLGALHWRGRSYDRFDGVSWTRSERMRPSSGYAEWYRQHWSGPLVAQRIYGAALDSRVLFGLHPMLEVEPESPISPQIDQVGDFSYRGGSTPVYTAYSMVEEPSVETLRGAGGNFRPDRNRYLQLPELPQRIHDLADSLTRGVENRYDRVVTIERWLRSELGYTLDLPRSADEATLDSFLFERRQGHCEYFSTAMVVLLRSVGIEARNVNGFLGGSWNEVGAFLAISQNDAHSWVEVWFPSVGWVTFDPTPAGGDARTSSIWMWPGRIVFDALQHRWGKWVLDYSLMDQTNVLLRAADALAGDREVQEAGRLLSIIGWLFMAALIVTGTYLLLRRGGSEGTRETRLYLSLVESARGAGLVSGQVAPLELLERIRGFGAGAAGPSSRVISLYVRARFAGEELAEEERREMEVALRAARRSLGNRALRGATG